MPGPLRVLFVTRKWPPAVGGMELYSRELAAAMARHAEVEVLALPGREDGSPPTAAALVGFLLRAATQLAVQGRRYDAIHFGDFVLFPLAAWAALVAPRSQRRVTVHGLDLVFGRRRGWKPAVYRRYVAVACRLQGAVHCFVANSSATARVAQEIGLRRVVPIPLGITLAPEQMAPQDVGSGCGASSQRYVLFVGRLVPRKGAAWFAENVLPRLPEDVTFKIVGTVWDNDELQRALANARVEYLGRVPDDELLRLRRGAAVTVMPNRRLDDSDMEGFGLAALEAAVNGSILLASGVEGIVDAVIHGDTGFLLPEGNAEEWAAKIREILGWQPGDRQAFLCKARRIIAERYSWDRVAKQTLNPQAPSGG